MSLDTKVTEERDADHSRLEILESQFSSKMYHYCREIIFMLGIMFTTYAAFQTAPPKTSKSPTPVPFFPQTSLVADFYQGHIGPPFERVAGSDISFVMYYAPWDAESQATRSQFKLVAQYYYKQLANALVVLSPTAEDGEIEVYFAAINCWQPLGECKQQFAKVQHFPVLIVYTQLTKGIQYKGVKEATHMIHFLSSVLHSVERIDSVNDIVQLMNFHDVVTCSELMLPGNALKCRGTLPQRSILASFPVDHIFVFHCIYSPEEELLHTPSAPKTTGGHNVSGVGVIAASQRKPLQRILSAMSECLTLLSMFLRHSGQGYHTFYTTSLKLLEKDPYREIGFGVITNVKVANELGIHLAPTIRLYLWNETLEYGSDEPYTPEALTKWVVANAHQVSVWLSPPGIKSLTLSPYVEEDSVMILFTPRNLLYTVNYNYNLLREVGQEYYNCDDNPWVKDFVHYLGNERAMSRDMYTDLELQCSQWREKVRREELTAPPIQVVSHFWANGSCSGRRRCKMCTTCSDKCLVNAQDVSKDCKCDGGPGFDSYPHQQVCWKQTHHGSNVGSSHPTSVKTSMLTGKDDERSSENLIEAAIEESCLRFHQAHNAHTPVFPRATYHRKTPRNFTGLACRTNKTLSFLAMDSVQFHQFAEGLGVNVLARKDKTAVVIFNAVDESSYLLEAELSKGSLVDFIVNYTEGFLSRSLRSTARKPIALNRAILSELPLSFCCYPLPPTATHVAGILSYLPPQLTFLGTLSYIPPQLTLLGLYLTSHRNSCCRDSILSPTVTHVAGTLSYLPPRLTLPGLYPIAHRDTHVAGTPSLYLSTLPICLSLSLAILRDGLHPPLWQSPRVSEHNVAVVMTLTSYP
uniref:Thioredoxin domain-containing protein n=1 Tax=Timema cristinae TaxID=61476 RepID=A0A7R9CKV0_TIMCR|nr:unnamed protein product [Timema cristinae]